MPVTTQAFLDGGTGALKSTLRFPFAAEGATAPLSRGGGTAARSRATCRRANHLLAAASTADAAPARASLTAAAAAVAAACLWKTSRRAALRCLRLLSCAGMADDAPSPPPAAADVRCCPHCSCGCCGCYVAQRTFNVGRLQTAHGARVR